MKQAESLLPSYINFSGDSFSEEVEPSLSRIQYADGNVAQRSRKIDPITLWKVSCELSLENYAKFRVWVADDLQQGSKSFLFVPPFRPAVDLSAVVLPYGYAGPSAPVKIGRIVEGKYDVNSLGSLNVIVSFTIEALGY